CDPRRALGSGGSRFAGADPGGSVYCRLLAAVRWRRTAGPPGSGSVGPGASPAARCPDALQPQARYFSRPPGDCRRVSAAVYLRVRGPAQRLPVNALEHLATRRYKMLDADDMATREPAGDDERVYELQVRICKAFANSSRLRMLDLLAKRECSVSE